MDNVAGIYMIKSLSLQNKVYIGGSINIKARWITHRTTMKRGIANARLQKHFDKYGLSDLSFTVLLICNKNELPIKEQEYIDKYKPYFNYSNVNRTQRRKSKMEFQYSDNL